LLRTLNLDSTQSGVLFMTPDKGFRPARTVIGRRLKHWRFHKNDLQLMDMLDREVDQQFIEYHLDKIIDKVGFFQSVSYYTQALWRIFNDSQSKESKSRPTLLGEILRRASGSKDAGAKE